MVTTVYRTADGGSAGDMGSKGGDGGDGGKLAAAATAWTSTDAMARVEVDGGAVIAFMCAQRSVSRRELRDVHDRHTR